MLTFKDFVAKWNNKYDIMSFIPQYKMSVRGKTSNIFISLTMGKKAVVDFCDSDLLNFKWRTKYEPGSGNSYGIREVNKKGKTWSEHLHRVILERKINRKLKKDEVTDHIDRNGLNNRRNNLRAVTHSVNMTNTRLRKDNSTGHKGIYHNKEKKGYDVYINKDKIRYRLGRFKSLGEAIKARQKGEIKYWNL